MKRCLDAVPVDRVERSFILLGCLLRGLEKYAVLKMSYMRAGGVALCMSFTPLTRERRLPRQTILTNDVKDTHVIWLMKELSTGKRWGHCWWSGSIPHHLYVL